MTQPIHAFSAAIFTRTLGNLSTILAKADAHAQARKIEPSALLGSRLFPDMLPLTRQVQIACDFAKGSVARLCGEEPPKWDDTEDSFETLRARIARTIEFVASFAETRFEGAAERSVTVTLRDGPRTFTGQVYLAHMVLPNFFFHVTTAYDLLRHGGVEIGKRDYIGAP